VLRDVLRSVVSLSLLALVGTGACADHADAPKSNPNEGLLRDFLDGKFDGAGHPLNAKTIEAETSCSGSARDGAIELSGACEMVVPAGATSGELVVNTRLRVISAPSSGTIVKITVLDADGQELGKETLSVSRLRGRKSAIDVAVNLQATNAAKIRIEPRGGSRIEVDYVEIFPKKFGLVVAPGSGVTADSDLLTFELPHLRKLEMLDADGVDLLPLLDQLLAAGIATKTTTGFRTLIEVPVIDLLPNRADVVELQVRGGDAARVQLRKQAHACVFEGDPAGTKVLITGFQPFPADGWHENVSAVAVTNMNPANLRGAQVMRMVLPVEYDRAPAMIAEAIERCAPEVVISFGQGGGAIALEKTAYNLQDTGEISGGVPDNRGVIRGAVPIDPTQGAERSTLLPLDAIRTAMEALGEFPEDSDDPGRYICNNTMWNNVGVMTARGGRGGFIHLPFTTRFDAEVNARWASVVEAAIQATVDQK
jgi:pyroglutamyl-peptidase